MATGSRAVRFLRRRGLQRGLLGDSSGWLTVYAVITGLNWLRRLTTPEPKVVTERLEPGERLLVTHARVTKRKSR